MKVRDLKDIRVRQHNIGRNVNKRLLTHKENDT